MKILSILTMDPSALSGPPSEEQMARMNELVAEMKSKGVTIDTGGRSPDMFEMIVSRTDGTTTVTDGPYAESKELVGGYALFDVKDRDEALEWTNRFLELVGNATCHLHEVETFK